MSIRTSISRRPPRSRELRRLLPRRRWLRRLLPAALNAPPNDPAERAHGAAPRRHWLLGICLFTTLGGAAAVARGAAATPAELQSLVELEDLARSQAAHALPAPTDKQRLQVGPLQPQLKLPRCSTPIAAAQAPGVPMAGRTVIELRCDSAPWHVFVPVRLVGTARAVLAAHALIAGTVLTPSDLTTEQRDLVSLPPGYLDDPGIAVGLTAARAVAGGAVLTNQQLLGTQAVQRGQSVTLVADAGGISVRMEGRALTDGFINQRIKVLNVSSGKVVEGIARSSQVVEIIF